MTQKIEVIDQVQLDGSIIEIAVITHEDGSYTSMLKSTFDEQQAALETPLVIDEAAAE